MGRTAIFPLGHITLQSVDLVIPLGYVKDVTIISFHGESVIRDQGGCGVHEYVHSYAIVLLSKLHVLLLEEWHSWLRAVVVCCVWCVLVTLASEDFCSFHFY